MFGFIPLNKPLGLTSHDCVAQVRRLLKMKKVGHGGTLDPLATGVLPIAVGKATRLLPFMPENKAYRAIIRFGMQTTTDDLEGEVIQRQPTSDLTLEDIKPFLSHFIGKIEQIPPAYSAIQQGGKRLYELARLGKTVEVPVRTVEITKIDVLNWYAGEFGELEVLIYCGPGTYIRAIARDLGEKLQVGGTLAGLERTESCGMRLSDSITLEQLKIEVEQGNFTPISPELGLKHLIGVSLLEIEGQRWCQGQKISYPSFNGVSVPQIVRVHEEGGKFLGMGEIVLGETGQILIPKVVM